MTKLFTFVFVFLWLNILSYASYLRKNNDVNDTDNNISTNYLYDVIVIKYQLNISDINEKYQTCKKYYENNIKPINGTPFMEYIEYWDSGDKETTKLLDSVCKRIYSYPIKKVKKNEFKFKITYEHMQKNDQCIKYYENNVRGLNHNATINDFFEYYYINDESMEDLFKRVCNTIFEKYRKITH
jgi:hypothetical protein